MASSPPLSRTQPLHSPGASPAGPACCSRTESVCTSDGNLERIAESGWLTGSVTGQAVGESLKYQPSVLVAGLCWTSRDRNIISGHCQDDISLTFH